MRKEIETITEGQADFRRSNMNLKKKKRRTEMLKRQIKYQIRYR